MALEQLSRQNTEGCQAKGIHKNVIQDVGATRTLLDTESGSLCLFDRAAGNVYTLPAPVAGMSFEFLVTVDVTTNANQVSTDAATTFLVGGVIMGDVTVATSGDYFEADGTAIVGIAGDGATAGGLIGERYECIAISTTVWAINGVCHGAGTLTTPFI